MPMNPLHRRMLDIGISATAELGLVLAGGYAVQAHELVDRPSKDVDFAYCETTPVAEVVETLVAAYRNMGFDVDVIQVNARLARMDVHTPEGTCEVDVMKEALQRPTNSALGPVVSFEDAVGLKVRAIAGRTVPRDFIDVHAASKHFTWRQLERLCARHDPGFELADFADRVGAAEHLDDITFRAYGLDDERIADIRRWAVAWRDDIKVRLASDPDGKDDGPQRFNWDRYLNEREGG
ncbi:nucleotidyl transferase AbiEii/AbiGii toxin family protein [Cryptosporangium sp. NPDC048952]|uniref:nucleotidyl transferase AbiEii/AbiGii toxin family protein n=1 Tax=Cryptosporangium sp. NPDC048952 TaxID=3363961 RepID=UPI00370FF5B4